MRVAWDFRFWPFFRSVFRFFHLKTSVLVSVAVCSFSFFYIYNFKHLVFGFQPKCKRLFSDLASVEVFGFSIWFSNYAP